MPRVIPWAFFVYTLNPMGYLIFAGHGHYFPSLQTIGKGKETAERAELADLYDQAQEARGDRRRAFRWGKA